MVNENFQILNQEVLCQAILEPKAKEGYYVSGKDVLPLH